jgi:hypothetical protein
MTLSEDSVAVIAEGTAGKEYLSTGEEYAEAPVPLMARTL